MKLREYKPGPTQITIAIPIVLGVFEDIPRMGLKRGHVRKRWVVYDRPGLNAAIDFIVSTRRLDHHDGEDPRYYLVRPEGYSQMEIDLYQFSTFTTVTFEPINHVEYELTTGDHELISRTIQNQAGQL